MEFIRGLHNIKPHHKGCILTIGNFDGFHLGHKLLIEKLHKKKVLYKLPIIVMIFEPQPKEYFSNVTRIRLTRLRDKIYYLFSAGVDVVLCITFNSNFADIKAYNFIKKVLVYKLGVRFVYVGDDFRFGAYREGDFRFLRKVGKIEGFKVIKVDTYIGKNGNKISSTAVRTALIEDRILDAELLMGHSYCISGKVVKGNSLGRTLGFPTANVHLDKQFPIRGVYAVKVYGVLKSSMFGIANIGVCPTIFGKSRQRLEVHILNIFINLYYYHIRVVFLAKIRDEQRFDSLNRLRCQIQSDVAMVHDFFQRNHSTSMIGVLCDD